MVQISLKSGLIEDNWMLISAPDSVCYCRVDVSEEIYLTSHRYIIGKGKSILIAFLGHCGCSSLILHQNLISGNFLKVSSNV